MPLSTALTRKTPERGPAGRDSPYGNAVTSKPVGGLVHLSTGFGYLAGCSGGRLGVRGRDGAVVDGTSLLGALEQPMCDTLLEGVPHDGDLGRALRVSLGQCRGHLGGGLRFPLVREVPGDQFAPGRLAYRLGRGVPPGRGLLPGTRTGLRGATRLSGRSPALGLPRGRHGHRRLAGLALARGRRLGGTQHLLHLDQDLLTLLQLDELVLQTGQLGTRPVLLAPVRREIIRDPLRVVRADAGCRCVFGHAVLVLRSLCLKQVGRLMLPTPTKAGRR